jgi:hypothetical protein
VTVANQQPDGSAPAEAGANGELVNEPPDFLVWSPQFRREGAIAVQAYGDALRAGDGGESEAQVMCQIQVSFILILIFVCHRYWI